MGEQAVTTKSKPTRSSSVPRRLPIIGRRRKYLINRPYQLRITALVVGVVFVFLLIVNVALYSLSMESNQHLVELVPELADFLEAHNEVQTTRLILGSLVLLVGVVLVSIIETHKTAGAAFAINRGLKCARKGDYTFRVKLRKGDNLRELEESFNDLATSLQERARSEAELFAELAQRVEDTHKEVAAQLRHLMEERQGRMQD